MFDDIDYKDNIDISENEFADFEYEEDTTTRVETTCSQEDVCFIQSSSRNITQDIQQY
jgi:hypothetical protein